LFKGEFLGAVPAPVVLFALAKVTLFLADFSEVPAPLYSRDYQEQRTDCGTSLLHFGKCLELAVAHYDALKELRENYLEMSKTQCDASGKLDPDIQQDICEIDTNYKRKHAVGGFD
jgi:hypothetical protein